MSSASDTVISIRVEAPEEVDDTVVIWSSGRREYIQAKLSISPRSNAWRALWNHFYKQYTSPDFDKEPGGDTITLAVNWTPQMVALEGMLQRAKTSDSSQEWLERLTEPQQRLLDSLKTILTVDDDNLFKFCHFVQVWLLTFEGDPMETDTFEAEIRRKLHGVVEPTTNVFAVLMNLTGRTARLRGAWQVDDLVRHLEQQGLQIPAPEVPLPPDEFKQLHPNPYLVGAPLRSPDDLFFGRDELLNAILWRIHKHSEDRMAPNAVLLYGPHRSGKTSVLLQLSHRVGPLCAPIYVDLAGCSIVSEATSALEAIATQIVDSLQQVGIDVAGPSHTEFTEHLVQATNTLMRRVVSVCAPQQPVLMLDESDSLSDFSSDLQVTQRFLNFIRSLVEQNRDVFFVFASCRDMRWIADAGVSRLLTLADECIQVGLLSEQETVALMLEPVSDLFSYSQDALAHLVDLSGRHPCFVQLICRQAVEWRNRNGVNLVPAEALGEIVAMAIERGHLQFIDLWNGLTLDERVILYALARIGSDEDYVTAEEIQGQISAVRLRVGEWDIALDSLVHAGLVRIQENCIRLHLGILQHWIDRMPMQALLFVGRARTIGEVS
jgi:hypothetical protein